MAALSSISTDPLGQLEDRNEKLSQKARQGWKRFANNRAAAIGVGVIVALTLIAVIGPLVAPFDPLRVSSTRLSAPSTTHIMGTDDLGRDIFSGVLHGARPTLLIGLSVALISSVIGTLIGALAGYYGGAADSWLMRTTELFQVLPSFLLALAIIAITGPGLSKIVIVLSFLSWPPTARLVRVQYLSFREKEFVEAARTIGQSDRVIIIRHILPNAMPPAIVVGSLVVAQAILSAAGLSFLGLGDPNTIDWGEQLNQAQRFMTKAWWLSAFPGFAIFLTVMAFNLVGDGVNDALNPRLRDR